MFNRKLKKQIEDLREDVRELKSIILTEMQKKARFKRGDIVQYEYKDYDPFFGPFDKSGVSIINRVTFRNGKLSYHLENGSIIPESKATLMTCKRETK